MLAESYARSFDLPVVVLRPFNTYGPRQSERAVIPTVVRQALDPGCPTIRIGDTSPKRDRSEEHTSELQSLMRISYAVFCLKKKTIHEHQQHTITVPYTVMINTHT